MLGSFLPPSPEVFSLAILEGSSFLSVTPSSSSSPPLHSSPLHSFPVLSSHLSARRSLSTLCAAIGAGALAPSGGRKHANPHSSTKVYTKWRRRHASPHSSTDGGTRAPIAAQTVHTKRRIQTRDPYSSTNGPHRAADGDTLASISTNGPHRAADGDTCAHIATQTVQTEWRTEIHDLP